MSDNSAAPPPLLRSMAWASAGRLAAQSISWIATLWVMRLLSPSDYGMMAMAMIAVSAFQLFEEGGLGAVVVCAPVLDDMLVRKIFGVALAIGVVLTTTLIIVAPVVAQLLGDKGLTQILRALAVLLISGSLIVIPRSLLERRLAFRRIAVTEVVTALVASLLTLVLAVRGMGVWALVGGSIAQSLVRAVMINLVSPHIGRPLFELRGLSGALRFGGTVVTERVLWYGYSQADVFLAGRVLGTATAGLYVVGKELAELPLDKLLPGAQQAALPTFARFQENIAALGPKLERGIGIVSLLSFPALFGLAAVASDLLPLVLGARWAGATLPLSAYAATLPFGLVSGVLLSALKAVGRPDLSLRNVVAGSLLMVTAFAIGVRWGLAGLAGAWVIAYPLHFGATVVRSARALGTSVQSIAVRMSGPFLASLVMLAVVTAFRWWAEARGVGSHVRLGVAILVGMGVYLSISAVLMRPALREAVLVLRPRTGMTS